MTSKFTLTYFHAMGLAEPIRYLLVYGEADFEDIRLEYEKFQEIKRDFPLCQLPVLENDGKVLYQSIAICRFLANKFNLCGTNEEHALDCDIVVDTITDFRLYFKDVHFTVDQNLKEMKKDKLLRETAPFYLSRFESLVNENGGYFVGANLTWADLYFAAILCFMESLVKVNLLEDYPNLQNLREKVNSLPKLKKWIDSRPMTDL